MKVKKKIANMITKNLILLMGNIGSGKSTYSKKYQKKGYIILSRDNLRYAIGGGKYIFNVDYEPIIKKTDLYMFKKFVESEVNIVLDETNVNKEMRKKYIPYAKKRGYRITVIELPRFCKEESVKRRMKKSHGKFPKYIWEKVWTNFDKLYERPSLAEGINHIIHIERDKVI